MRATRPPPGSPGTPAAGSQPPRGEEPRRALERLCVGVLASRGVSPPAAGRMREQVLRWRQCPAVELIPVAFGFSWRFQTSRSAESHLGCALLEFPAFQGSAFGGGLHTEVATRQQGLPRVTRLRRDLGQRGPEVAPSCLHAALDPLKVHFHAVDFSVILIL